MGERELPISQISLPPFCNLPHTVRNVEMSHARHLTQEQYHNQIFVLFEQLSYQLIDGHGNQVIITCTLDFDWYFFKAKMKTSYCPKLLVGFVIQNQFCCIITNHTVPFAFLKKKKKKKKCSNSGFFAIFFPVFATLEIPLAIFSSASCTLPMCYSTMFPPLGPNPRPCHSIKLNNVTGCTKIRVSCVCIFY